MRFRLVVIFCVVTGAQAVYSEERPAEQIYKVSCATCHMSGVANAPKANDEAAWKARGKSIEELVISSKKGLNVMPPMGLCMDCSDNELKEVIKYMMSKPSTK